MKVTQGLRGWAVKNCGLAADASDEIVTKAVSESIVSDKLTIVEYGELTKGDSGTIVKTMIADEVKGLETRIDARFGQFEALLTKFAGGTSAAGAAAVTAPLAEPAGTKAAVVAAKEGDMTPAQKAMAMGAGAGISAAGSDGANAADGYNVRVKSVVEQFSDNRSAALWSKSSNPRIQKALAAGYMQDGVVRSGSEGDAIRDVEMGTQRSKAIAGAWHKHLINRQFRSKGMQVPRAYRMTEMDRKLVEYAVHECKFVGPFEFDDANNVNDADHWFNGEKLTSDLHKKALLDDTLSGGVEAVPYEYDDAVIVTPLLNGQIFPFVQMVNVGRRRMHGMQIANPTLTWGTAEGSQIPLFNTDSLIAAFDTTIFPVSAGIEIGMDFEADSPIGVAEILMGRFGQAFLQEMDNVLVTGSGINRPLGMLNTAGVSVVTGTGAGNVPAVADYEGMYFGIKKPFRDIPTPNFAFISTETNYARARGIQVATTDQRRVFGTDNYDSYSLIGKRNAINESLPNTIGLGVCMSYYRLYRRQGYEVRVVTEDAELARKNQRLIIVRARFGGQMTLSGRDDQDRQLGGIMLAD